MTGGPAGCADGRAGFAQGPFGIQVGDHQPLLLQRREQIRWQAGWRTGTGWQMPRMARHWAWQPFPRTMAGKAE